MPAVNGLDVQSFALLLGIFLPIVVAFLLKKEASSGLKIVTNLVGTIGVALIAIYSETDGHLTFWLVVNTSVVTLVASLASYRGIWRPLNLNSYTAPKVGLGGTPPAVQK